jgi:hypothetical protein
LKGFAEALAHLKEKEKNAITSFDCSFIAQFISIAYSTPFYSVAF